MSEPYLRSACTQWANLLDKQIEQLGLYLGRNHQRRREGCCWSPACRSSLSSLALQLREGKQIRGGTGESEQGERASATAAAASVNHPWGRPNERGQRSEREENVGDSGGRGAREAAPWGAHGGGDEAGPRVRRRATARAGEGGGAGQRAPMRRCGRRWWVGAAARGEMQIDWGEGRPAGSSWIF